MYQTKIITEAEFIKKYGFCKDNTRHYEGYITNMRYCLAGEKLNELISIYNTGRSFLINAVNSDDWYNKLRLTDSVSILWHRHTYLLMSALLFNHCLDYFYQILWSFLDSAEWKNQNDIKKHLKDCNERTIKREVKKLSEVYRKSENIPHYDIIKRTQDVYDSCHKMRNDLVNNLKHRGYIICDDLEPKFLDTVWENEDGSEITSNDYTTRFSLADEEEIVLECFERITPLIDEYVKFLDPTNFFQEENGNIMIGKIKDFPDWKTEKS